MVLYGVGWRATESDRWVIMPTAGKIKNFRIVSVLAGSPGAGTSFDFTLFVDGIATALTCELANTDTSTDDLINEISVTAGQTLSIQVVPTNTPSAISVRHSFLFVGDNAKESVIMGTNFQLGASTSATEYDSIFGGSGISPGPTEGDFQQLCACKGTISDLYVQLESDPGTDPDAFRYTIRKNGSSTTLTVTITADATTGNDTSNSFTVEPGDLLNIMIEPLNTPSVAVEAAWGMVFTADIDGESPLMGGNPSFKAGSTEFNGFRLSGFDWSSIEGTHQSLCAATFMKDLYLDLSVAPGAPETRTFTVKINGSATVLALTIEGSDTTGNNTTDTLRLLNADLLSIVSTSSGNPVDTVARWGVVVTVIPDVAVGGGMARNLVFTEII